MMAGLCLPGGIAADIPDMRVFFLLMIVYTIDSNQDDGSTIYFSTK